MLGKLFALLCLSAVALVDANVVPRGGSRPPPPPPQPPRTCKTIAELAVQTPGFTRLVQALSAAGLVGALSNPNGPKLTVFAPNDVAFSKVGAGTTAALFAIRNKPVLTSLLTYHVAPGNVTSNQLTNGQRLPTLNGNPLTVGVSPAGVTINNARVILPNIVACNGIVHVIDSVLIPPGFEQALIVGRRSSD